LLCPVVVGRSDELATLRAALESAVAGRGSIILVVGEPGLGKTRLLREVHGWCAARGLASLVGRAVQTASPVPFRPLVEALLAADRAAAVRDDPQVAPFRGVLATLVPSWASAGATVSAVAPLLQVAEGFLRVARCCARDRGGVVVLLDDLQWADPETLAVIDYLADQVPLEPVLIVGSTRPEFERDSVRALQGLIDRRSASGMRLSRLNAEQTVQMTRACLGEPAVAAPVASLIQDRADGVPFFVEELLAALAADHALVRSKAGWVLRGLPRGHVPESFSASVHRRLSALPPSAREVLWIAALLGRRIDPPLLCAINRFGGPG
jgi:predicted ATPase